MASWRRDSVWLITPLKVTIAASMVSRAHLVVSSASVIAFSKFVFDSSVTCSRFLATFSARSTAFREDLAASSASPLEDLLISLAVDSTSRQVWDACWAISLASLPVSSARVSSRRVS